MDKNRSNSDKNSHLVQSALTEFRVAWLSGNKMDPDAFCKAYPSCSSELRARIEGFLNIATNNQGSGPRKSKESVQANKVSRFELGGSKSKKPAAGTTKPKAQSTEKTPSKKPEEKAEIKPRSVIHEGAVPLQEKLDRVKRMDAPPLGYFREVSLIILKAAEALNHAHKAGRVHGTLIPSQLLIEGDKVKITGFEKQAKENIFSRFQANEWDLGSDFPWTIAPEQAIPHSSGITEQTDIFSLGLILYEMLTLTKPFKGHTSLRILKRLLLAEPKDPSSLNKRIPLDLSLICLRAIEKRPNDRFSSMLEFSNSLKRFLSGEKILLPGKGLGSKTRKQWGKVRAYLMMSGITRKVFLGWGKKLLAWMGAPIFWSGRVIMKKPAVSIAAVVSVCCIALSLFFLHYYPKMVQEIDDKEKLSRNAITAKKMEEQRNKELQDNKEQMVNELKSKETALKLSEGQRLTALSENALKFDPSLALLLAVEGANRNYNTQAEMALMNALFQCYERKTIFHDDHICEAEFSPDGKLLATISCDGVAKIHETATGEQTRIFRNPHAGLTSVAFSHDGRKVAFGTQEGVITVRDVSVGVVVDTIRAHEPWAAIRSLNFSSDGRWLISGGEDGLARIWDLFTGTDQAVLLKGHAGWSHVHTADFNESRGIALTAANDRSARLWDVNTGENLFFMSGPAARVRSASFSPDGQFVLIVTEDNAARIWDWKSGANLGDFRMTGAKILSAQFGPKGKLLALTGDDGNAKICPFLPRRGGFQLKGHRLPASCASFSPDGEKLVIGANDGVASLWDLTTKEKVIDFKGHKGPVHRVKFSPDGKYVATISSDNTARIWNTKLDDAIIEEKNKSGQLGEYIYTSASNNSLLVAMNALSRKLTFEEKKLYNIWSDQEKKARKIIGKLNKDFIFSDDVIQVLSEDPSIPQNILKHVIEIIRNRTKNQGNELERLVDQSFNTVMMPKMGGAVYRRASHIAQAALRLDPDDSLALSVLGMTQYRLGAYGLALGNLQRSHTINQSSFGESLPATVAFLSMSLYRVNRVDDGRLAFQVFAATAQKAPHNTNRVINMLGKELGVLAKSKEKLDAPSNPSAQEDKEKLKTLLKKIFLKSVDDQQKEFDLDESAKRMVQEAALEIMNEQNQTKGQKNKK